MAKTTKKRGKRVKTQDQKKKFYEQTEKVFNQALEAAKVSVKVVSEKAGEAAHVTRLMIEKVTLEHKVSKQFATIGSRIYEKATREGEEKYLQDSEIKELVGKARDLDAQLGQVEALLQSEKQAQTASK